MAKLIMWNLMTLDGCFEGAEKWDLDFHTLGWGPEMEEMSKAFGKDALALVFGRVTYEGMKAYWTKAEDNEIARFMNALPKLVASRTLTGSDWNNTRVTADIAGEIAKLKAQPEKNIYVFGSAELADSLLKAGLVDELILGLVPATLGKGTPLFKSDEMLRRFSLLKSRPLENGTMILHYAPAAA